MRGHGEASMWMLWVVPVVLLAYTLERWERPCISLCLDETRHTQDTLTFGEIMRRRKQIMDWTSNSRVYKVIRMSYLDPHCESGCWCYKRANNSWKEHRKYQERGR